MALVLSLQHHVILRGDAGEWRMWQRLGREGTVRTCADIILILKTTCYSNRDTSVLALNVDPWLR
jgi:hypothetical protein